MHAGSHFHARVVNAEHAQEFGHASLNGLLAESKLADLGLADWQKPLLGSATDRPHERDA